MFYKGVENFGLKPFLNKKEKNLSFCLDRLPSFLAQQSTGSRPPLQAHAHAPPWASAQQQPRQPTSRPSRCRTGPACRSHTAADATGPARQGPSLTSIRITRMRPPPPDPTPCAHPDVPRGLQRLPHPHPSPPASPRGHSAPPTTRNPSTKLAAPPPTSPRPSRRRSRRLAAATAKVSVISCSQGRDERVDTLGAFSLPPYALQGLDGVARRRRRVAPSPWPFLAAADARIGPAAPRAARPCHRHGFSCPIAPRSKPAARPAMAPPRPAPPPRVRARSRAWSTVDPWSTARASVHSRARRPGLSHAATWPAEPVTCVDFGHFVERPPLFFKINPQSTAVQK